MPGYVHTKASQGEISQLTVVIQEYTERGEGEWWERVEEESDRGEC